MQITYKSKTWPKHTGFIEMFICDMLKFQKYNNLVTSRRNVYLKFASISSDVPPLASHGNTRPSKALAAKTLSI